MMWTLIILIAVFLMYTVAGIVVGTLLVVLHLEHNPYGYLGYNAAMQWGCLLSQMLLGGMLIWHLNVAHKEEQSKSTTTSDNGITSDSSLVNL